MGAIASQEVFNDGLLIDEPPDAEYYCECPFCETLWPRGSHSVFRRGGEIVACTECCYKDFVEADDCGVRA